MAYGEFILIASIVLVTVAWFWSLIDCAMRQHERDMDKLVWVAIIISTYIFGSKVDDGLTSKAPPFSPRHVRPDLAVAGNILLARS
jgi:hypothetical protein